MTLDQMSREELLEQLIEIKKRQYYDHLKKLAKTSKNNSAKKGFEEFSMATDDLPYLTHCPIIGVELTFTQHEGRQKSNASIHRIDSNKGYVKGNVMVVCDLANRMMQDATDEELLSFSDGIRDFVESKNAV